MEDIKADHELSSVRSKTAGKLPEDTGKPDEKERAYSKTDSRYWTQAAGRLFKDHGAADYSCRFSVRGTRGQLCLGTPNMKTAAKKAAAAVLLVMAEGADVYLSTFARTIKSTFAQSPTRTSFYLG